MSKHGFVVCPNEDCEHEFPFDSVAPYDPGRTYGPPENCYPPEGGFIDGPDKCPKCGAELDDKYWEDRYAEWEEEEIEREQQARADAAEAAAEARAERYEYDEPDWWD